MYIGKAAIRIPNSNKIKIVVASFLFPSLSA